MTQLFSRITSLVSELSSLQPVGMYSMGDQVAVALNRSDRAGPRPGPRYGSRPGPGPGSRGDEGDILWVDENDAARAAWHDSSPDGTGEPDQRDQRHQRDEPDQREKRDNRDRQRQPDEENEPDEASKQPRPEGAPWDAVLLTGIGLPSREALADISSQLRPGARLIVLVTFTAPTPVEAESLADSWLEMDLGVTAIVPSPTALLVLARRLTVREALLRRGRRQLAQNRKTEWTEALGGCMKPEILHKDQVFVQYGRSPGMGDVALIQTDEGLVAHRILARITLGTASYLVQGGDRGGLFLSPEWAVLGKVTAARSPGDDSPRILPTRPQPATRILVELARLALPDQTSMAGRILRAAFHATQNILDLAKKLDENLKNVPWPRKPTGGTP